MKFNINNVHFAYWIGVLQSDGHIKTLNKNNGKKLQHYVGLGVGRKSLPMLNKFMKLSKSFFNVKGCFYSGVKKEGFEEFQYSFGCNYFMDFFRKIDLKSKDFEPPKFILSSRKLFGAYLAGIIDGDGNINISRKEYPQCKVRIYSGKEEPQLVKAIEKILNCEVNQIKRRFKTKIGDREFISNVVNIEFRVFPKNFNFIETFVLPNMALDYKSKQVKKYIKFRRVTIGI